MQELRPLGKARQFLSAADGKDFPTVDLSGKQRLAEHLHTELSRLNKPLGNALTREYGRLLNQSSLQVRVGEWQNQPIPAANHWLAAFDAATPTSMACFGFDNKTLFSLSELFFGGNPAKLTEEALAKRTPSETEQRLAVRLFNAVLGIICPELGLNLAGWQSRWLSTPPEIQGLCTEIRIESDDCQLQLYCCWPLDLFGEQNDEPSVQPDLTDSLSNNLKSVKVKLKVELAQLELSLDDLMQLRKGDILRVNLNDTVVAMAGQTACVTGQVCEHGDQLALKVMNGVGDLYE